MFRYLKPIVSLCWDAWRPMNVKEVIGAKKIFWPLWNFQKSWYQYHFKEKLVRTIPVWQYLQSCMLPLIFKDASSYHIEGIKQLRLDQETQPHFSDFAELFFQRSRGFTLQEVAEEIEPLTYFTLIKNKKFPCVKTLRGHEEIFCANAPDFWHEAIGHIAPLCFSAVQDWYLAIAEHMLASKNASEFSDNLSVAWSLMEYGFIKENETMKMFGAAVVGSHLAHVRYFHQVIALEKATRDSILKANFYALDQPLARGPNGKLRFFYLENLIVI